MNCIVLASMYGSMQRHPLHTGYFSLNRIELVEVTWTVKGLGHFRHGKTDYPNCLQDGSETPRNRPSEGCLTALGPLQKTFNGSKNAWPLTGPATSFFFLSHWSLVELQLYHE